ncbi:hypothetical protein GWI33_014309 [Rhynchophorus ferrugineus]|uniref:Uncharacterized protein n=1 Tax=Rhynchophorus ferrugineus TaxID=354439 RepID=A0A834I5A6_RHYFE|nr:hypothetical protein GWI33_014309 [Rhynchophorus ferrugineus]
MAREYPSRHLFHLPASKERMPQYHRHLPTFSTWRSRCHEHLLVSQMPDLRASIAAFVSTLVQVTLDIIKDATFLYWKKSDAKLDSDK